MYRTQRSYLWLWLFIVVKFSVDTAPLLLYCRIEQKVMARNFCGSLFLRFGQSSFSCWELIFALFKKSRSNALITFRFYWGRAIEIQIFNLRQYFAPVKRIAVIKLHFITSGVPEMTDYSGLPSSFCFKLTIHSIKYDWKGQERTRGVLLIEVSVKRELSVFYVILFITPCFITSVHVLGAQNDCFL